MAHSVNVHKPIIPEQVFCVLSGSMPNELGVHLSGVDVKQICLLYFPDCGL